MREGSPPPGARLAARILRWILPREEADEVFADLDELSRTRSGWRRAAYFWTGLAGYPVRVWWDRYMDGARGGVHGFGRGGGEMDGMGKDLGYAVRSLRRSPGFALMTTTILAVSIGAATAIASVVRGVLLDPLPFEEPEALQALWIVKGDGERARMTPGNLSDLRGLEGVFESVAGFQGWSAALNTDGGAIFLRGGGVTPGYFETLGVQPLVGRGFLPEEGAPDAPLTVVLGAALWRQTFGADPSIVGATVELDGTPARVVGVVPTGVYPTTVTVSADIPFNAASQDFFVPLRYTPELWDLRRPHILGAVGRLHDGVDPRTAEAALATLTARLQSTDPFNRDERLVMNDFGEEVVGDVRFALVTLLATVGLVLLIAVVNVGGLFVLRADDRRSEIDVRLALGAPWSRIRRQLVVESLLVAVAASLAAVVLAARGIDVMRWLVPYQVPRLDAVAIDVGALLGAVGLAVLLALLFGSLPGWNVRSGRIGGGARGTTAGSGKRRLQSGVVAVQAGLAVVVLVGAVLLARSYSALRSVDVGFEALDAWVVPVSGAGARAQDVLDAVRALPGVQAAALTYDHPLERNWSDAFLIPDRPGDEREATPSGSLRPFGDGYFEAAGIRVVEGRVPDAVDLAGPARWAVVNEALRDAYFPDRSPVGATIEVPSAGRMFGDSAAAYVVMGVVENVRFLGPEQPVEPAFYLPLSHFPVGASTLLVRPVRPDVAIVPAVRAAVAEHAPGAAVQSALRLRDVLDDLTARRRFNMMLLVSFAGIGLLLSGLGAYSLVGRSVVTRLREIGIRMALGAGRRELATAVVGSALKPMAVGGAVGLVAAALLVRSLRALLFGVGPGDPLSFVLSTVFLVGVGCLAAALPTARALAVDPATTLRSDG